MSEKISETFSKNFSFLAKGGACGGKSLSLAKISAEIREKYGVDVTPQHLSRLISGASSNPGIVLVAALADYFSVEIEYFIRDNTKAVTQIKSEENEKMRKISDLCSELLVLDDEALKSVRQYVDAWQAVKSHSSSSNASSQ